MASSPKKERSYGIIPLRCSEDCWEVLLVQHRAGHWSFPKGHSEREETPLESATRELFEETGLRPKRFLGEAPLEECYHYERAGLTQNKTVEYFLAEVEGVLTLQAEELAASRWIPIAEAASFVTFPEGKRLCAEIINRLR